MILRLIYQRTDWAFTWFNNNGCLWWQVTVGSSVE
ncbi:uncharacterized protein METZ01_LOCUS268186 [marine metagenome]|uniref:Uncharacterized protein n=1 Tax=marine metagenome TaxID=408172 RepID=A0A382JVH1_9ZZZZ